MAHRLAHSWHAIFWRGAIALVFAVTVFAWPMLTLTGLLVIFGAFALLDGALALLLAMRESPRTRWSFALLAEGIVGVLAGTLALFVPWVAQPLITALIAAWAVTTGMLEIAAASALRRDVSTSVALVAGGLVSIAAGVLVFARPADAVVIAWTLGTYALAFGLLLVFLSFRLHRAGRTTLPTQPRSVRRALHGGMS
jgi:uncharacterized membrane protein HdeD (DUF308 family)